MILKMLKSSDELKQLGFDLPENPFPKCRIEFEAQPFGDQYWWDDDDGKLDIATRAQTAIVYLMSENLRSYLRIGLNPH